MNTQSEKPNAGSKKILIYYVYEVLRRYSNPEHVLTQREISKYIHKEYGMRSDRKAIGRNIMALTEAGIDISTYEDNGEGYYLKDPLFTDAEIRMLIDTVLASRYITGRGAQYLIDNLKKLATVYFENRTRHITQAARWVHTDNQNVFLNIELLDEAIEKHKRVQFVYNCYGLDMKLHPRHDYFYEVDPYQIISSNGRYYLVGNYDKHDCVTNFRIDLITGVALLDSPYTPFEALPNKNKTLDIAEYVKYSVNMYDGNKITATLRLKPERIGDVIDWFGKEIAIMPADGDGYIQVKVTGTDNGIRVWALQYGRIVEIMSPKGLREKVKADLAGMIEKYR